LLKSENEYAFVDKDTYDALHRMVMNIEKLSNTGHVYSITKFVNWINGRLSDCSEPVLPLSSAEIGESLELLTGRTVGVGAESLIAPLYSVVRVRILCINAAWSIGVKLFIVFSHLLL